MKKIFISIIFLQLNLIFCVDKPIIKTGLNSTTNLQLVKENNSLYPEKFQDMVYLSFEEKISKYFSFRHKIDFQWSQTNKATKNLSELTSFLLNNSIYLNFAINDKNKINIFTKPIMDIEKNQPSFKATNKIEYRLSLQNFLFSVYYSHNFAIKQNELFNHKLNFSFYWNFTKLEFVKFKTTFNINFQHYIFENKYVFPIKSGNLSFEVAIDFNKTDFNELFDKKEEDE
ncbi:MAG: hypothetical protein A2Y34_12405 [Spirochaetes bacterium GWC1_27_15]|nr:MAG: hypothetical protein A2Y34_12405 [Spirochaetes bacterium GWC1_27_15]